MTNPAHYRMMFGGFKRLSGSDAELQGDAEAGLSGPGRRDPSMQSAGVIRGEDRVALGRFIWATVHGIAMLAIDGSSDPIRRSRRR